MMRWLRLVILLLVLGLGAFPIQAQDQQEIILLRRENPAPWASRYGNLYTYHIGDAAPTPLTTLANITAPALAPDGSTIAYAAISEEVLTQASAGDYTFSPDYADPMDIWLMNVRSHELIQITKEAANRSNPVWSPDSTKLAWFTWDGTAHGGSVIVYDRETGAETTLATGLMMNADDIGAFTLANVVGWGETIAHTVKVGTGLLLETVNESGDIQQQVIADTDYLPRVVWAKDGSKQVIAWQDMNDQWQVVEPETETQNDLSTPPLLQLPDGTGAKLKPTSTAWEILPSNGEVVSIPYEGIAVLAPNGKAVAYLRERSAYLWEEDQEITPLLPDAAANWEIITLIWSPMDWVIVNPVHTSLLTTH